MDEKKNCGPKFARVAWFNRDNKEHNYGTWQSMATTTPEEYSKLNDQELLDLHNTGTVKGGYLVALETVIAFKAKASMNK